MESRVLQKNPSKQLIRQAYMDQYNKPHVKLTQVNSIEVLEIIVTVSKVWDWSPTRSPFWMIHPAANGQLAEDCEESVVRNGAPT